MKLEKDKILAHLQKIISDKKFSRSKTNVRLLRFLVESTLNNIDVKESTIGTEFFGSHYDPVKSDNNVRVYIYHLRKKLDEYYAQNAKPGDIVFRIAKGQYNVQFDKFQKTSTYKKVSLHIVSLVAVTILTTVIGILLYKKPVNGFWENLMKNNFPTTVIFGDYFTIEGPTTTSSKGITRDYEINSEQELHEFLKINPELEGKMHPSRHHYFNWMAPYCSRNITEFWVEYNYPFDITQISEWSVAQLAKENLVYFGQSKSMGMLKNIISENFPQYSFRSQIVERKDPNTNTIISYGDIVNYNDKIIDYTVVAKISMPTGNEMRFFLSDQDCGAISALNYFTQNDSVAAFYKRHDLEKHDDFIALFKVSGWQRKSYEMEFLLLDKK
ncbi:hypothetical protein [Saccharicrinis aurantiacus]|uniref:hypothetical protein n=1 Tax=Saccharicrinis aurantiacus TaxID=1849719 RepID=UPI00248FC9C7|nr:hypothetical protein [Saccharicrinis aurantiacus]